MGTLKVSSAILIIAFWLCTTAETGATPLLLKDVTNACLNPHNDMKLLAWSYQSGYLLCVTGDENAEGEALYRERAVGSRRFILVKGVGGYFRARDLVNYGVPPTIARELYDEVQRRLKH